MSPSEKAKFARLIVAALSGALPPAGLARVNLAAVMAAADPALAAGWPGEDLARQAIIGAACADSPGAIVVGNLRALAAAPPPARPEATRSDPARVTAPQPLPQCANCGQPVRRGVAPHECPGCGAAPLRQTEFDIAATVRRTPHPAIDERAAATRAAARRRA